jgi:hypothetical protein
MANLGIQNNNPGNLRDTSTGNFQVFKTPEEGHQALIKDITLKQSGQSSHIKPGASIEDLGNVWAPPSDNNVKGNWASNVAKFLGVPTAYAFDKIPPEKLAEGIKVAEGTNSMKTDNSQSLNQPSQNKQLSHDQLVSNINAMEQQGAKPEEIQGYLDSLKNKTSDTPPTRKTFADELGITTQQAPSQDTQNLKATTGNKTADALTSLVPGGTAAMAGAYGLSGNQDEVIKANERNMQTQGDLIKRIKENKAKGEDTSRLQKALTDLTQQISQTGNSISDLGTGGITNNQVISSAASLAALPLSSYIETAVTGGGILGTNTGLATGLIGKASPLGNPFVQSALNEGLQSGEDIASLSRQSATDILSSKLKDITLSGVGGKAETAIVKALDFLAPAAKQSILNKAIGVGTGFLSGLGSAAAVKSGYEKFIK